MIRKLLTYLSVTLLLLAGGCSSDEPLHAPDKGGTSLNLLIPSTVLSRATGDTRAPGDTDSDHQSDSGDVSTDEGKIVGNFYVVAFYKEGTTLKHFYEPLTPEMGQSVDGVYRSYSFNVAPGTYDIYLVANVPAMKAKVEGITDSEQLQTEVSELVHSYYTDSELTLPTLTTGLPMACELLGKKVADGQPTTLHAPLEFLCSKVRLTVIHESDLGQKGLQLTQVGVKNVYSPVNCFAAGASKAYTSTGLTKKSDVGTYAHYALPDNLVGKTVQELAKIPTGTETDLLDFSSASKLEGNALSSSMANVAQAICYLPETPEYDATHPATTLVTSFANANGDGKSIDFPLGCTTQPSANRQVGCNRLQRGHFYDVVAKFVGGDIMFSWTISDWSPETLSIKLAGNTTLWLESVEIADGDKDEPAVDGENAYRIPYLTSAPRLTFESCKVGNNPVFDVVENKSEGVLEVSLNSSVTQAIVNSSDFPKGDALGFWVVAGSVRKWVRVKSVDASTFFRITPDDRYLYISQIVNETSYPLVYEFATNMDSFTLNLEDYVNKNTSRGKANLSIAVYTGTYTGTLEGLSQLTEEVSMVASTNGTTRNLKDIPFIASRSTETWPKSGVIVITVYDPSNQQAFGQKITGSIKGEGTSGSDKKQDHGNFEINPAPQKYTIHFKAINDGTWEMPHIYVYQPLTWYNSSTKQECYIFSQDAKYNRLEYSFTGNLVFKGWKSENGEIDDPQGDPENITMAGGSTFPGYKKWDFGGTTYDSAYYYDNIDMLGQHRTDIKTQSNCEDCHKSNLATFPGIVMYKEEDTEDYKGWWKIELPMLAEPGKALIMFSNCHSWYDGVKRYPDAEVPGIPLPNFASCEAWFLWDKNKKDIVDFADYPRTSYAGAGTDYSKTWVNVQGEFNSWGNNGVHPGSDGISKHSDLAIGNKRFQIDVYEEDSKTHNYYAVGTINQNEWVEISDNQSNMYIKDAGQNDKFDVYFNVETHEIKVVKK